MRPASCGWHERPAKAPPPPLLERYTPRVGCPDDVALGEDSHLGVVVLFDSRVLVHGEVHIHLRYGGSQLLWHQTKTKTKTKIRTETKTETEKRTARSSTTRAAIKQQQQVMEDWDIKHIPNTVPENW